MFNFRRFKSKKIFINMFNVSKIITETTKELLSKIGNKFISKLINLTV